MTHGNEIQSQMPYICIGYLSVSNFPNVIVKLYLWYLLKTHNFQISITKSDNPWECIIKQTTYCYFQEQNTETFFFKGWWLAIDDNSSQTIVYFDAMLIVNLIISSAPYQLLYYTERKTHITATTIRLKCLILRQPSVLVHTASEDQDLIWKPSVI